jgi:acyl-CoA thioester hydrolase/1,4-dihydroxy-2-naphthoyl-CoA hydrolase
MRKQVQQKENIDKLKVIGYVWKKKVVKMFSSNQKIFFYDADPAGIIFYANLFKIAHAAYEEFMGHLKLDRNYFFDKDFVLPIVHTEGDFLKPIKVGDELKVEIWVSQIKKSSFELNYKFSQMNNHVAAKVKTVHVCVSKITFVKTEVPFDLKSKLRQHLIE